MSEPASVTRVRDAYRALYRYLKPDQGGLDVYLELGAAVGDLINGENTSDDERARASRFCGWYREAHFRLVKSKSGRPVPYTPSQAVSQRDMGSALSLVSGYDDETLHIIAEAWLQIPGEKLNGQLGYGQQRTVSMLSAMAAEIAGRL